MVTHSYHSLGNADVATLVRATPAAHDDTELLRLISEFIRLERAADAIWAAASDLSNDEISDQPECKSLYAAQRPLFDRIMTLRATTLEGFKARARMLHVWDKELEAECGEDSGWPDRMKLALVMDLIEKDRS